MPARNVSRGFTCHGLAPSSFSSVAIARSLVCAPPERGRYKDKKEIHCTRIRQYPQKSGVIWKICIGTITQCDSTLKAYAVEKSLQEDIAALQGHVDLRQAQAPPRAPPARHSMDRTNEDHLNPRAGQLVTPRFRTVSQVLPVFESGPSAALVRIDDVARQMVTALRSVSTDSPWRLLMRSKRRSQLGHFRDVPTSSNTDGNS
ncbi:hypothetical protein HPB51_027523 [Rhipicephalus microplus]|uniref:Uncharacterized protein n=1 Tax=Rhipicephalus microplus TaxID=6941 RepID=A0A9J6CZN8_RHIMP|nr:hypothetical protein HPB51_027523 [Rhipicephalus microplus]